MSPRALPWLALLLLSVAPVAWANDRPYYWHPWRLRDWPGKQPARCDGAPPPHTFERAGYPNEISKCARPSENCTYGGYHVGGGCPCSGGPPTCHEGTWGWDYVGFKCLRPKVMLNWCRDRYQGGTGAYKTDGPPVPDVGPILNEIKKGPPGHRGGEEHH